MGAASIAVSIAVLPPGFDALRYVASHGDLVMAIGTNAVAARNHCLDAGFAEGRRISFDAIQYLASNAELIAAFGSNTNAATAHYILAGRPEGRAVNFETQAYWATNTAARDSAGRDALALARHCIETGHAQGLSAQLDGLRYIASHAHLIAAFRLNVAAGVLHFQQVGYSEGRTASFDAAAYLARHADLRAAFGSNLAAATQHYIAAGAAEGRTWQTIPAAIQSTDKRLVPAMQILSAEASAEAAGGFQGNSQEAGRSAAGEVWFAVLGEGYGAVLSGMAVDGFAPAWRSQRSTSGYQGASARDQGRLNQEEGAWSHAAWASLRPAFQRGIDRNIAGLAVAA